MKGDPHGGSGMPRIAPQLAGVSGGDPNASVLMFVEDVQLGIMPMDGPACGFRIELEGKPDQVRGAVTLLESLSPIGHAEGDLAKLVSAVVVEVGRRLAWRGRAMYAIERGGSQSGGILQRFTCRRLLRVFGQYLQFLPRVDRRFWKRAFFRIPARDVWDVGMPRELGGTSGYSRMVKRIGQFEHLIPSFLLGELKEGNWPTHYDSQRYVREVEFFVALTTVRWGWNQRDYSERNCTEFYLVDRSLRFRWARAVLREHIVGEINGLFERLEVDAKIRVRGLPAASEVLRVREQLHAGRIGLGDAVRACAG